MNTKVLSKTKYQLSLVIPAKNEGSRISRTISQYATFIQKHQLSVELIIVINGTSDNTKEIVQKYQAQFPFISILETSYASGKGGAIALGISQAKGKYIGFVDADGSYTISETYNLYNKLQNSPQLDGVIASRKIEGAQSDQKESLSRKFYSFGFHLLIKIFFGLIYKDTQSGLKIFKSSVIKELVSKLVVTKWTFDVNLLLLAKYLNLVIEEIPVKVVTKNGSKLNFKSAFTQVTSELITLKYFDLKYQFQILKDRLVKHFSFKLAPTKPNILILSRRYIKHPEAGGAEVYLQKVAEYLTKDNNVYVFTSRAGNLTDRDTINNVNVIRRGGQFTVYIYAFIYYLLYFRKDMNLILDIQTGIPFFTPLYSAKPKVALVHHFGGKQFFSEVKFPFSLIGYVMEQYIAPFVYRNQKFITVSESTKAELQTKRIKEKNIYLAFNAVDAKASLVRRNSTPTLSYVGRLKKYKQVEIAIETIAALASKYPQLQLMIGGTGDQEQTLQDLASNLNVTDKVNFLGYITEQDKNDLLKESMVFLMPSNKEGFGITILEAGKQGTPTIGFDVAGVKNAIINNQTGILVNTKAEFIQAVDNLLANDTLRIGMGKQAKKFANTFSWNKTAEKVSKILLAQLNNNLDTNKVYPWDLQFEKVSYNLTK